ncbi:hypothetical protein, partial [Streptomyces sp. SID69]|uniref:hypothetical protein n=1 Tax=Streptomyces sp. SID69 TaxID=2690323 RepID=UPI001F30B8D5
MSVVLRGRAARAASTGRWAGGHPAFTRAPPFPSYARPPRPARVVRGPLAGPSRRPQPADMSGPKRLRTAVWTSSSSAG